jgi:hypothetical protein
VETIFTNSTITSSEVDFSLTRSNYVYVSAF